MSDQALSAALARALRQKTPPLDAHEACALCLEDGLHLDLRMDESGEALCLALRIGRAIAFDKRQLLPRLLRASLELAAQGAGHCALDPFNDMIFVCGTLHLHDHDSAAAETEVCRLVQAGQKLRASLARDQLIAA